VPIIPLGQSFAMPVVSQNRTEEKMTKSSDFDTLPSKAPLGSAETQDQFASVCREVEQEIQPNDMIEQDSVHLPP
jgi:hypothetical protein